MEQSMLTKKPRGDSDPHCSHNSPDLTVIKLQYFYFQMVSKPIFFISVSCINYACRDSQPPHFRAGQDSFFLPSCSSALVLPSGDAFSKVLPPSCSHSLPILSSTQSTHRSSHTGRALSYTINGCLAASSRVLMTRRAQTEQSKPAMNKYS